MKKKIIPDDNNSESLQELKERVRKIVEDLEKEESLKNSIENYKKLINLNNNIERKFQIHSKKIGENTKDKINKISKKNAKKS
tara:strand:+ start:206 stop:454 length:249 start_codon:yes stop_codon:yes gene_type:complete